MKKFSFNLQSVLDHRLVLEDQEQEKLAKIQQALLLAMCHSQRIEEEIRKQRSRMSLGPGEIDLEEIGLITQYISKLQAEAETVAQKIAKLEAERQRQSERLIQARRDREVLENLREKSLSNHEYTVRMLEQKLLDELTAAKFKSADEQNLPTADDSIQH